jgi:phage tail-like protein
VAADAVNDNPAFAVFFSVSIDGLDLGSWTTLSGLSMKIETTNRGETAMTFFQHHLPGSMSYGNVQLSRPVSPDTEKVLAWLSAYHMLPTPLTAVINCLDQTGTPVVTFNLIGVTPVGWTGPSMDAAQPSVAKETLELAHMGFM